MWKVFFHTGLYFLTQRRSFEISIFLLITSVIFSEDWPPCSAAPNCVCCLSPLLSSHLQDLNGEKINLLRLLRPCKWRLPAGPKRRLLFTNRRIVIPQTRLLINISMITSSLSHHSFPSQPFVKGTERNGTISADILLACAHLPCSV